MRLDRKDAMKRLVEMGYEGTEHPQSVVFYSSSHGLRAGTAVGTLGTTYIMQCVLKQKSVELFSAHNPAKKSKKVPVALFFTLLKEWERQVPKERVLARGPAGDYPQGNARYLLTKAVEINLADCSRQPLQKYFSLLAEKEAWDREIKVNLFNINPEYLLLACNSRVRPNPPIVWENSGARGVYMALGGTREALERLGATVMEQLCSESDAFVIKFEEKPVVGLHGGAYEGIVFFGWRSKIMDLLLSCPASVDMKKICVIKGVAYLSEYRLLAERLAANATTLFVGLATEEFLRKVTGPRTWREIMKMVELASTRKRKRALKIGTPPDCILRTLYPKDNESRPKHEQRWKVAAVVQRVKTLTDLSVFDFLDTIAIKAAWAKMPSDSRKEFFAGLGIEGTSPSKPYPQSCRTMNDSIPGGCAFNGDVCACAASKGIAVSEGLSGPHAVWTQ